MLEEFEDNQGELLRSEFTYFNLQICREFNSFKY